MKDQTVVPANALAITEQWRGVHEVQNAPETTWIDGHKRKVWTDVHGRDAIELVEIAGMGHGTPIDVASGYGSAGPYMLDVRLSSTQHIARSWGLIASFEKRVDPNLGAQNQSSASVQPASATQNYGSIQQTIDNALRAAGLKK